MAFQISLRSNTAEIVREYEDGICLNGPHEVGLKHIVFWNTTYNVTSKNNVLLLLKMKDELKFEAGDIKLEDMCHYWYTITVPPGFYDIEDILDHLMRDKLAKETKLQLRLLKKSMTIEISCDWIVDFSGYNSIGKLLGFSHDRKILPTNVAESDKPINVISIHNIKVNCNLVRSNIEDLKRNVNTIYKFPIDTSSIGAKIIKEPNPIYYFEANTDKIYKLVVTLTDQSNNIIDLRKEEINLTMAFRPINNNG